MGYPEYPNNRLIVNGVDLSTTYGLIMIDGYVLGTPEIKTYVVDIPGGNGQIDLTESLLGDTSYGNRKQEFTFYIVNSENFEQTKTNISNFLHGRYFTYEITMDPGYIYEGRFSVTSYNHGRTSSGILGMIQISIDAAPFKHKPVQISMINAVGGNRVKFDSGRERVRPTIQAGSFVKVIYNNKLLILSNGSWVVDDLLFKNGENFVYFNSYPIYNLTWGNLTTDQVTWGQFKNVRLFEWYKSKGDLTYVTRTWNEISGNTWGELRTSSWSDLTYLDDLPSDIRDVYISYEWGDL